MNYDGWCLRILPFLDFLEDYADEANHDGAFYPAAGRSAVAG
jgi:hypothetical protein